MLGLKRRPEFPSGTHIEAWRSLGFSNLTNTVRQICTLCGWTQASTGPGQSLAIVSAVEQEGKSSLARAVSVAMAQDHAGQVLLVEVDLLRPTLSQDFGIEPSPGLSEVLSGVLPWSAAVRPTRLPNLFVLPAGGVSGNPTRLLRSPAMASLLREARGRFSFIIVDLPAVLRSSDAAVVAGLTDGAVLVVRAGSTDKRDVQQAVQLLASVRLYGVVLNRWRSSVPDIVRRVVQV